MRLTLYIDGKKIGSGSFSVSTTAIAHFWGDAETMIAELTRCRLDFVAANGIHLSGFAETGKTDRHGMRIYKFREWWMPYETEDAK